MSKLKETHRVTFINGEVIEFTHSNSSSWFIIATATNRYLLSADNIEYVDYNLKIDELVIVFNGSYSFSLKNEEKARGIYNYITWMKGIPNNLP